jgi:hypothetical protein
MDYVDASLTLGVSQRFADSWDVGGSITRSRLSYGNVSSPINSAVTIGFPDETFIGWMTETGYSFSRTRVGVRVERFERQATAQLRAYQRFRIGSTLTYEF